MLQTVGLLRSLAAAANSASETCLAPVKLLFKSCSKPNFDVCRKLPKCVFAQYLTTIFKIPTCVRFFKNVIDLQIAQSSSKKEPKFDVCQICQILARLRYWRRWVWAGAGSGWRNGGMRSVGWVAGEVEVLGGGGGGWVKPKLKATKCGLEEHRAGGGSGRWIGLGWGWGSLPHPHPPVRPPPQTIPKIDQSEPT